MTAADEGAVAEMVDRFYHSPAVEHEGTWPFSTGPFRRRYPAEPLTRAWCWRKTSPGGLPLYVHRLFR